MDFPLLTREPPLIKPAAMPQVAPRRDAPDQPSGAGAALAAGCASTPARATAALSPSDWLVSLQACTAECAWADSLRDVLLRIQSRLGAYRVSVGWARAGGCHLVAWTDVTPLDEGVGVQELEAATAEALGWSHGLMWPQVSASSPPPDVETEAHQALFRAQGLTALLTVPLRDSVGVVRGVVVCERIPTVHAQGRTARHDEVSECPAFSADDLCWLDELLGVLGPVLAMRHRLEQPWYMRSWGKFARLAQRLNDPRERWLRGAVLACFGSAAFLFGWPLPYTVSAPARLEPHSQTALVAPMAAVVQQTQFRVGDVVRGGQALGRLLPLSGVSPDSPGGPSDIGAAAPQSVMAPFDGVILSRGAGNVVGQAVQPGDTLWVIAPGLDWRVILQIDERDIARVHAGQRAVLRLTGAPDRSLNLAVGKVVPVMVEGERHARYEVVAQVTGGTVAGLRPGQHGVAQIDMLPKPMLQRAWDAARRAWYLSAWGLW